MSWELTPDAAEFLTRAEEFLAASPIEQNVLLTNARLRAKGVVDPAPPVFATARAGDAVVGAAMHTPPYGLLLSLMAEPLVDDLVDTLAAIGRRLPAVTGPEPLSARFATRWSAVTGARTAAGMRQRMYRLDAVTHPSGVPGHARVADDGDRGTMRAWAAAFTAETGVVGADDVDRMVTRRLAAGEFVVWDDDSPVAVAAATPPAAGIVRIGYVYTPPALRGRGYASAVVAAASQRALDGGAIACMLYTDLANPTSNAIYQRIGYRPVMDAGEVRFVVD